MQERHWRLWYGLFGLLFIGVCLLVGLGANRWLGMDPTQELTWTAAAAGEPPIPSYYSPLPYWLSSGWQMVFGPGLLSAITYKSVLYGLALLLCGRVAMALFNDGRIVLLALSTTLFSPYLTWSVFAGRDVALELAAVSILMFLAVRPVALERDFQVNKYAYLIALGLAGAWVTSIREPDILLLPLMTVAMLLWRRLAWRAVALVWGTMLVGLLPLLVWNFQATGTITLSTRLGINMYYGNHPFYLAGHPRYDIDGFLWRRVQVELNQIAPQPVSLVEGNAVLIRESVGFMLDDPVQTLYRSTLKVMWWLGPTRIPGSDVGAYFHSEEDQIIIHRNAQPVKELFYIWHRLLILGLVAAAFWLSREDRKRLLFLCLPVLALLPAAVLTFPDTRFRLALDPYTFMVAAAGVVLLWQKVRPSRSGPPVTPERL